MTQFTQGYNIYHKSYAWYHLKTLMKQVGHGLCDEYKKDNFVVQRPVNQVHSCGTISLLNDLFVHPF